MNSASRESLVYEEVKDMVLNYNVKKAEKGTFYESPRSNDVEIQERDDFH